MDIAAVLDPHITERNIWLRVNHYEKKGFLSIVNGFETHEHTWKKTLEWHIEFKTLLPKGVFLIKI